MSFKASVSLFIFILDDLSIGVSEALNDTIDEIDLIDIYRTSHPKPADYTFFSSAHETFSRIDHILGHKSNQIGRASCRERV